MAFKKNLKKRVENLESVLKLYLNSPIYVSDVDVGFNGQRLRKKVFEEIVASIEFDIIVETGTFTGNSAGYMAETSDVPIYTCEINEWFYLVARNRLAGYSNDIVILFFLTMIHEHF